MRWMRVVFAVMVWVTGARAALGQRPQLYELPLHTEIRVNGLYFENLFQAPDGQPQENVKGLQVEGRIEGDLGATGAWKGYGRLSASDFDHGLDPSETLGLGLQGGSKVHRLDLYAEYSNDRPSVDVDIVDQADVGRLSAIYDFRGLENWQFSALGTLEQQKYAHAVANDNRFWSAGAAVRYRGFGRAFSPELGFTTGKRDVDSANESYDQDESWVRVISEPVDALYLALRYRLRRRDYTVGVPAASNFGRSDDRPQWSLVASYRTGEHLLWNLYWSREQSNSSRPGVDFTTQYVIAGVGWRF